MFRQLILCIALMAAQVAGQSVCCCQFDSESLHESVVHKTQCQHAPCHSHSSNLTTGCHCSADCDDDHHHSHCNCDSPTLVYVNEAPGIRSDDDRQIQVIAIMNSGFAGEIESNAHCRTWTIPMQFQGLVPRAQLGIWQL